MWHPGPQCLSPCSDQLLHECCVCGMFASSWRQSTSQSPCSQALEDSAEAKVDHLHHLQVSGLDPSES